MGEVEKEREVDRLSRGGRRRNEGFIVSKHWPGNEGKGKEAEEMREEANKLSRGGRRRKEEFE